MPVKRPELNFFAVSVALALLLALPASQSQANPWDGVYQPVPGADCSQVGVEGGAVRIKDGVFSGTQATCQMQRPVKVRSMNATLYDMSCEGVPDAEGNTPAPWAERVLVMRAADDGLIMVWDGYAFQFERCDVDDWTDWVRVPQGATTE